MKRSALNEIQGVLVTADRLDLAKKMVVKGSKGRPKHIKRGKDIAKKLINAYKKNDYSILNNFNSSNRAIRFESEAVQDVIEEEIKNKLKNDPSGMGTLFRVMEGNLK